MQDLARGRNVQSDRYCGTGNNAAFRRQDGEVIVAFNQRPLGNDACDGDAIVAANTANGSGG